MKDSLTDRLKGDLPVETPEEAASRIDDDATIAVSSLGGGPKEVPKHLVSEHECEKSLTFLGTADTGVVADHSLIDEVERRYPFAVWAPVKKAINEERMKFTDTHLSQVPDEVRQGYYGGVDTAVIEAVAAGDDWFVPSTVVGATPAYVEQAEELIIEVNHELPLGLSQLHDTYAPGVNEPVELASPADNIEGPRIEFDPEKLVSVVETDTRPPSYPFRDLTEDEDRIIQNFADFVQKEIDENPLIDGHVSFEMGVGALGNAVANSLDEVDFGDITPYYYGEVLQDSVLDLLDEGVISEASAMSMVLSAEWKDRLLNNAEEYAESIALRPLSVSNDPGSIRRFNVIGTNSAVEVDVYGNVNSSHVRGTRLLQGIGGSGDFSRHSLVSVFILRSKVRGKDISTIVPMTSHTDHTEHDTSVIITEQGIADLRGLAPRERAEELIQNCAHPDYRDDLREYLEESESGHIPHDLSRCFDTV
jgi:succinyl-CoA:acetate CoA-transferase